MAYIPTLPGQNANTGDARAKFLKLFSGQVMTAFAKKNIAMNLVTVKTISGVKTSQFIVTGRISEDSVAEHVAGAEIATIAFETNERTITIGQPFYVAALLSKFEEVLSQFDDRSIIAEQQAEALATKIDKTIFRGIYDTRLVAPMAGQTAAVSVDVDFGVLAAPSDKGDLLVAAAFDAQAALDANDVTAEGRVFVTKPVYYYNIVQSQKAINRDFNVMDNGSIGSGRVLNVAGLKIIQTNHLPVLEADGTTATKLIGMVFTKDVYGVLKSVDVTSEANYDPNRLGTILTSYYAIGYGSLNPSVLACIFDATV